VFKSVRIGVLALLVAGCGAPKPRPAAPAPSKPPAPATGHAYHIDASQSELRILVYRAGPLARFGHNHVMVNRSLRGTVDLAEPLAASAFRVEVPVASFVVDDAQARREEGSDFAAEVPDDAKSGTLHNMLSEALLNADQFPVMSLDSRAAARAADRPSNGAADRTLTVSVIVSVAGHASTIDVPLTLHQEAQRLSASGTLELRQTALGLTPYSLMLGALQVQDAMTVKFTFIAT
jgi:hypothetical protein